MHYSKPRISRIQVDRQICPSYAKIRLMRREIEGYGKIAPEILSDMCNDPTYANASPTYARFTVVGSLVYYWGSVNDSVCRLWYCSPVLDTHLTVVIWTSHQSAPNTFPITISSLAMRTSSVIYAAGRDPGRLLTGVTAKAGTASLSESSRLNLSVASNP